MVAEKPSMEAGEMLSKESVEKPNMTGQVTKTLGTQAAQDRIMEENGRRFTYRFRDSNGLMLPPDERWTDKDGKSREWWEQKSLLRDWVQGRMSREEFDSHFPYYMGVPPEHCRIDYRADNRSPEELSDTENSESPVNPGDPWSEETYFMLQDNTAEMLRVVYFACRFGDDDDLPLQPCMEPSKKEEGFDKRSLKEDDKDEPRYAHHYGDGGGLPLRPGMGPPKTKEEFEEHYKKILAEEDEFFKMSEEEINAKFPEYKDMPESCCTTEHEACRIMTELDEARERKRSEEKK
ncbi:hypothetical protein FGADI_11761 [Fusarium gaditjirri]|uniref:Uncharacterized protein n=1 Tax=Fusarium gaditjirri TaxID=282569 RepID=A0A8H4STQ9_9HYPO|nr:hypothetical protein FGADI_11761 [Fusarium gaditjirri]